MMVKQRRILLMLLAFLLATPCVAQAASAPYALTAALAKSDIQRAAGLQLAPAKKTLYVGTDGVGTGVQMVATVKPAGVDGQLSWRSARPSVASVDENGYVTAHKTGTTTITCQTGDGSRLKRTCRITVKAQVPLSLTLEGEALSLAPGARHTLIYTIAPANAVNRNVSWKSSNPAVARVTSGGLVTAVKPGKATITCRTKAGGLSAKIQINVCYDESDIYYLAIGQGEYAHITALKGSHNDADRFVATLESCKFGQQSMRGIKLYDLTADQMRLSIASMTSSFAIDENDVTYLYYSGHGLSGSSQALRGALVGVDYGGSARSAYVSVDEMREMLDQIPGTVVVVLDCCLSGQYITAKSAANSPATVSQSELTRTAQGMLDAFKGGNATAKGINSLISGNANQGKYKIVVSCRPLELSYASSENYSVFTRYIGEAAGVTGALEQKIIVGDTLPADRDRNGLVSLAELKKYAAPKILGWSRKVANAAQNMMVWPASDPFPVFGRIA